MNKGFTLIELLVSVAIFMVVITVVLSLFTTGLIGQRKVIALQDIQESRSAALWDKQNSTEVPPALQPPRALHCLP